ncbi:nuclear transport factor 2 family protein [Tsukamurella spumae]|uniref:Nuclear transport factor 2 family protein n=1 Tax=Tsukamurella spumae TaxID=44753 RepID=A0A846X2I9_9ACTN|nr:nuclear transport factor 2 family protein [Tsukamurella spumae]NKY18539.1 nuclear transport factor 2 family protein [Tsukamurella spumae]
MVHSPRDDSNALQRLVDKDAIGDLLVHFSYVVDEKDWQAWADCFDDDPHVEFPFASFDGRDGLGEWAERALAPYPVTHHLNGNLEIVLDGDTAEARVKLLAAHLPSSGDPGTHFDVAGTYHWSLSRTPNGWRISRLRLEVAYTNGTDPSGLAPTA